MFEAFAISAVRPELVEGQSRAITDEASAHR
jgi:hypothetical protein